MLLRCDEANSIEAMEALEGTSADNLLLPSPFQKDSTALLPRGTMLQVKGRLGHYQQLQCV